MSPRDRKILALLLFVIYPVLLLALAWVFIPTATQATGSLSIPNVISAQPTGNLAASVLDANWTAIKDYLNAREVTIGTFAARPAASVSGRYYLATDINLGTYYVDTGSAWQQVGAGVTATTTYTNELASLTLINSSSTNINVTPGGAASDDSTLTNRVFMSLTADTIKLPDTAWAVGSSQGCLDTGAIALGTVHFFLITRTDTNVVDVLCSMSVSPTMPASYTKKRRIGSIPRFVASFSTVNLIASFTQVNDQFLYNSPVMDVDQANPGTAAVSRTLTVPTGTRVDALLGVRIDATTSGCDAFFVYLSSLDSQDMAPSVSIAPLFTWKGQCGANAFNGGSQETVRTNTSGQIRSRMGTASGAADTLRIVTRGWIDLLRRN